MGDQNVRSALWREDSRSVVDFLRDTPDCVASLDELVEAVPDDAHQWDRTEVWLHHVTLPKLSGVGLLEYDPRSDTVRYRGGECGGEDVREELLPREEGEGWSG